VARARLFLGEVMRRWSVPEETEMLARLALSELVTNAILHASGDVKVRVRPEAHAVWVGVSDGDDTLPVLRDPDPESIGSRGLRIVEAVAYRWGVDQKFSHPGKTVWFTVSFDQ
jgi:anti-sigma regulatory factor (Ser/Thr protein kinase)